MVSTREVIVRYSRRGGRRPPRDRERMVIYADGAFTLWRSVGAASYPPSPVGRFAGRLPARQLDELQKEATAAARAGDLELIPLPDASVETVELTGARLKLGRHDEPPGPWGVLVGQLRKWLGELTSFPQAAVGLEVLPGGAGARLVHLGSEPLRLNLDDLTVRAVLWKEHEKLGDWRLPAGEKDLSGEVMAGPGWSVSLPFEHGFSVPAGTQVAAYVSFTVYGDDELIAVALEARH